MLVVERRSFRPVSHRAPCFVSSPVLAVTYSPPPRLVITGEHRITEQIEHTYASRDFLQAPSRVTFIPTYFRVGEVIENYLSSSLQDNFGNL